MLSTPSPAAHKALPSSILTVALLITVKRNLFIVEVNWHR